MLCLEGIRTSRNIIFCHEVVLPLTFQNMSKQLGNRVEFLIFLTGGAQEPKRQTPIYFLWQHTGQSNGSLSSILSIKIARFTWKIIFILIYMLKKEKIVQLFILVRCIQDRGTKSGRKGAGWWQLAKSCSPLADPGVSFWT